MDPNTEVFEPFSEVKNNEDLVFANQIVSLDLILSQVCLCKSHDVFMLELIDRQLDNF